MNSKGNSRWLFKTEPSTYSFEDLLRDKKTHWNGVRNFQARNFLKEISEGDLALIYHSGEIRSVVGIARVIRKAYPDPDPKKSGDWVQVDIQAVRALEHPVSLSKIKATKALKDILLVKQSRLSVMPLLPSHFELIIEMGKTGDR